MTNTADGADVACKKDTGKRPLSPHLHIYRFRLTMLMSIIHRITGGILYFSMALFVSWLLAAALGPACFSKVNNLIASVPGYIILFGATWAMVNHLISGLRYLIWDTGYGLKERERERMTMVTTFSAPFLTLLLWIVAYALRGG
ncbi:MAG: succinate dehydrogenase, cytochrome b556 subunit [Alphaproteobacteria bacterium]|nr:succinate dehydrogenase, cytochrome b556 subunit [Alphaproteobacteria bacterium]